jgi:hypothetical protein
MRQLQIKMEKLFEISREKCHNFLLTNPFYINESFRVTYDSGGLYKKSELKIVNYGYAKGCLKWPVPQI